MASPNNQGQGNDDVASSANDQGNGGSGNDQGGGSGNDQGNGGSGNDQGNGNGNEPPCYCRGTLIRTPCGDVKVEELAIGDLVTTIAGEAKPIKWIGRRSYAGEFIAGNPAVLPIVVRAGALAPEIPVRDLWLSPGHALLIDGVMVASEHLINGLTILQAKAVDQVEYFHLEFEAHEVILAEAAAAESYVECDNRHRFNNAREFAALYPNDTRASFSYCLPRLEAGMAELAPIRARLFARAAALGHATTADPGLHLVVDGTTVAAQSVANGCHAFRLDAVPDEVWLASRCGIPAEMGLLSRDRRTLGVCVKQLVLRDDHQRLEISHSHPALSEGFHQDEEGVRRWTTGMGRVPEHFLRAFAGRLTIEVHCLPPLERYPLQPQIVAIPEQFVHTAASPTQSALSRARRAAASAETHAKGRTRRENSRLQAKVAAV